ncbi:MAG: hypothetical protein IPO45_12475 [Saprospiraceae bacterium]|jgi:hypothetical protein|uniref:hypothetical protein n=1 Tax=Candidatus Brachybacter algidus TaxID=2982024 RepID=UPI001B727199|nr:hypothetical protein [Candidatus Brachybacter algidus]MBP7307130.1 hypothetical protein [Saprospiraceae bacterium]MBK6373953.1 hypothetical protein [Candidatus Brachybacter algidus]MBK6449115.1 hypothetical protein [Candidatus Brachybacter algidus]MBK7602081.1 hypothetical protein [Candidatus Brachybacter algidus]MBK8355718.1 hypothetical protein [Candidatus Brachybacter algidus]
MPIEIKELKVNIQVTDKSVTLREIENLVAKLLRNHDEIIKQDFMTTIIKKEKINSSR